MVNQITISKNGASGFAPMELDDENEVEGRILTTEEFIERIRERGDIFTIYKEINLTNAEMISILFALIIGFWMSNVEMAVLPEAVDPGFLNKDSGVKGTVRTVPVPQVTEKPPVVRNISVTKKDLHATKQNRSVKSAQASKGGAGDPRTRVARAGLLGIINGQSKGKIVHGDIEGLGGFTEGIDAMLSGMGGLKKGGGSGIVRKGETGIGFGNGYGHSGFGEGGSGGIDDLIGNFQEASLDLKPFAGTKVKITIPDRLSGEGFIGGRSKAEILRVVMQNLQSLRYAYNKRLKIKPALQGKIVCKFAIDEFGRVIGCNLVESSIGDSELETTVKSMISRWKFEKIDKPGDITEIVYPFVFSS